MIKSKNEILEQIKAVLTDTSDSTLSVIEDITDTINDLETKVADKTDWESKFKENDESWRKKYRDRFFNTETDTDAIIKENEGDTTPLTFDKLFKEE